MLKSFLISGLLLVTLITSAQQSLTLKECIEIGFENNISLQQSDLDIENSGLSVNQSKAALLPNLNASASHGYNWGQTIDPFTNQFATSRIQSNSFGISTGVTVFNGFALQNQVKQAQLSMKISELGLETNKNTIALAIANAYLSILFNKEIHKANLTNLASSKEQEKRVTLLVDAGQVPEANLYQIKAQVASDEVRVINSENAISLSKLNLMQLIQLPTEKREGFDIATPTENAPTYLLPEKNSVKNSALNNFPEIRSAALGMENADLTLRIANGSRMPRLGASFSYGSGFSGARSRGIGETTLQTQTIGIVESSGQEVITAFPQFSTFETVPFFEQLETNVNRSLFFSLNIPIFNGLSNSTNIQRAKIGQQNAYLNSQNVKNQLEQAIESAYLDATAAYKTYESAKLSLEAQELAFSYAKIRYEEQVINAVDFIQSRNARDAALAEMIRSQYDYTFRLKILEFYQGKPITLN